MVKGELRDYLICEQTKTEPNSMPNEINERSESKLPFGRQWLLFSTLKKKTKYKIITHYCMKCTVSYNFFILAH